MEDFPEGTLEELIASRKRLEEGEARQISI
jgi:hypothetical protein